MKNLLAYIKFCIYLVLFFSCKGKLQQNQYFTQRHSQSTGLKFINRLNADTSLNLFSYMYYYNGAGIGAGDFNNDGLIDLFFAANVSGSSLYLNTGHLQFKDITLLSGIDDENGWNTGVSVVDINNDGLLDLYVCQVANLKKLSGRNRLFVCKKIDENGIPHYVDEASDYGLDFSGYSTHAGFFDYDKDGDLDMFLLNHAVNHDGNYAPRNNFEGQRDSLVGQRLYRNDKILKNGKLTSYFIDVSDKTGIRSTKIGYGLGLNISDINMDGWPDLYIGNDFHENDYLYINQKNGTFVDESTHQLMHTSQFSMGVDVADINNDAHPEIISMDMLPYDPYMLRRSLSEDDYSIFQQKLSYGYHYQYARNNLQLNQRNGKFSEIGQYAGVFATDWSWAPLWVDFNNDGNKDLFVSNGIPKRMNDIDYINFVSSEKLQNKLKYNGIQKQDLLLIDKFPEIKVPNQFFINKGDLNFSNITNAIYNNSPTFSNGAAYADLDNDGDLDIVVSNINDPVLLYENNSNSAYSKTEFVKIKPVGYPNQLYPLGLKLFVYANDKIYTYEQHPVHGFLSSMIGPMHIGLEGIRVDSAHIIWPNDKYQSIQLGKNNTVDVIYSPELPDFNYTEFTRNKSSINAIAFEDITNTIGITHSHIENPFNEFDREPLIPHMISAEGPALAVADINHDGLEDFFIGSSKGIPAEIYLQSTNGKFIPQHSPALRLDSMWEHVDAIWTDVNNDTHLDLIVATGGNEYYGNDKHLQPLLYSNDGNGNLTKRDDAFPLMNVTLSSVVKIDLNYDGYDDLFFAGRTIPWDYGNAPRSYLLLNDKNGKFRDVTSHYSKDLVAPGMVTSVTSEDINGDGYSDLLLSLDWGGIDLYLRQGNLFQKMPITTKLGWWQFAQPIDIDFDGDLDIVAGNFGLNSRLQASEDKPVTLYIHDFDDNGRTEQVMSYYISKEEIPFASKILLEKSMPSLKKRFLYAEDFAKVKIKSLLGDAKYKSSKKLKATYFGNSIFINEGKLKFSHLEMPPLAQLTAYRSCIQIERNLLFGGNYYYNNVEIGRQDADIGLLVSSQNNKTVASVPNISIEGQVRKIQPIKIKNRTAYILAKNNAFLQVIAKKN